MIVFTDANDTLAAAQTLVDMNLVGRLQVIGSGDDQGYQGKHTEGDHRVMSAINNGMSLMNLGQHYQYVVKALILLLAVFYDVYTRRKAGLG
jgi:predicted ABC-type sugar transport system permease subunit